MADDYLDLTTEQLLALARGLSFPDPMFLRSPPVSDWSEAIRTEVEILGVRSLLARDLVRVSDDGMQVPQQLHEAVSSICQPIVVVEAIRADSQGIQLATFYSNTTESVSHQPATGGNHRLRLFPTDRLLELIDRVCDIGDTDAPTGDIIRLDEQVILDATTNALADPKPEPKPDDLAALGISDEAAAALQAFGDDMALSNVTVLHRTSETEVSGSTTSWLSGNAAGSFVVTRDGTEAVITPAASSEIMTSITDGLPTRFLVEQS